MGIFTEDEKMERLEQAYDDLVCCIKGALGAFNTLTPMVRKYFQVGLDNAKHSLEDE